MASTRYLDLRAAQLCSKRYLTRAEANELGRIRAELERRNTSQLSLQLEVRRG